MPDRHVAAGLPTCDAHWTVMQVKKPVPTGGDACWMVVQVKKPAPTGSDAHRMVMQVKNLHLRGS